MDASLNAFAADGGLSTTELRALGENGFVVVPGPVSPGGRRQLVRAYDSAVAAADSEDVSIGRTTTRVHDFVNRGPEFDELYVHKPALEACCHVLGRPFKLSTMLARTLRPHAPAQDLHVDFERAADGWPMLGFIFMVDDFRADNGATRFVPGSHEWIHGPDDPTAHEDDGRTSPVLACGPAGSMILYNGSVRHGHSANVSDAPRRSIQGAYVRREARSGVDFAARMRSDTLARIGPLAKYLLAV
jgi:ectoine hydroxylase-related dioxygenase (phytanoyl-CoA dioxygenase family)